MHLHIAESVHHACGSSRICRDCIRAADRPLQKWDKHRNPMLDPTQFRRIVARYDRDSSSGKQACRSPEESIWSWPVNMNNVRSFPSNLPRCHHTSHDKAGQKQCKPRPAPQSVGSCLVVCQRLPGSRGISEATYSDSPPFGVSATSIGGGHNRHLDSASLQPQQDLSEPRSNDISLVPRKSRNEMDDPQGLPCGHEPSSFAASVFPRFESRSRRSASSSSWTDTIISPRNPARKHSTPTVTSSTTR